jgi:hypothetical protein
MHLASLSIPLFQNQANQFPSSRAHGSHPGHTVFSTVNVLCICATAQTLFFQINFDLSPFLAEPADHTHLFSHQVSDFQVVLFLSWWMRYGSLLDRPTDRSLSLCLVVSGTSSDELNIQVSPLPDAVPLTYNTPSRIASKTHSKCSTY